MIGVIVMTHKRYKELMDSDATLTDDEKKLGYHFCPDWDFLLIGIGMKEMECCGCNKI